MRERLFSLAKEDWRLWLDSDEWLDDKARLEIEKAVIDKENILYAFLRKAVMQLPLPAHIDARKIVAAIDPPPGAAEAGTAMDRQLMTAKSLIGPAGQLRNPAAYTDVNSRPARTW